MSNRIVQRSVRRSPVPPARKTAGWSGMAAKLDRASAVLSKARKKR